MAHRQIRIVRPVRSNVIQGVPVYPAGAIATQFSEAWQAAIDRMIREVMRDVDSLFVTFASDGESWAMDASLASQARILSNGLREKFDAIFARLASPLAEKTVKKIDKDSGVKLGASLRDMSGLMTLKVKDVMNPRLEDVLKASTIESANLIKRTGGKYLDQIQGAVMRSIQSGQGLADLKPELDKYGVQTKNWAKNVALDQTRKAFTAINAERMQALGVTKFKWVHSQGSNHPREYHRNVLNGKIFSFDDLPVIDERTGERGLPGQAVNCRCVMRPVFEFNDKD